MDAPLLETFSDDADKPRAFRRFSLSFTIQVGVSSDKPTSRGASPLSSTTATMTNASMSGLCFSSMTEFPEDAQIEIELSLGSQTHHVPAVVRRCLPVKRLGRTFYECGAQYIRSDATLRFLPLMAKYFLTRTADRSIAGNK